MNNINQKQQEPQTAPIKPLHNSEFKSQEPYPIECLGKILGNASRSLVRGLNISNSMAANSILAAASSCAQSKINVSLKHLTFPSSLFFITSAISGDRKSGAYNLAMKPILDFERRLSAEFKTKKQQLKDSDYESEIYIKEPYIVFDNATVEGIYKRFIDSQPYQSLSSPEGASLLGSHAMKDSHIKLIISLSKLWSLEKLHWVTAGGGSIDIPESSRLSMHLMIQPTLFSENILNNKTFIEQGFLSRVLFAEPESKMGTRIETVDDFLEFDINRDIDYLNYLKRIEDLMSFGFSIDPNKLNNFKTLTMNRECIEIWLNYKNEIEVENSDNGKYGAIKGIAAKSAEQAIRIASVITYIEHGKETESIPHNIMSDSINLAQWYLNEANRLFLKESIPQEVKDARTLLAWIETKGLHIITARDLSSKSPFQLRKKIRFAPAIELLEKKGYLKLHQNYDYNGKTLKQAWQVISTQEP